MISEVIGLHATGRSFLTVWLENTAEKAPLRPGRRMSYIDPVVDLLDKQLTLAARTRQKQALNMVMGTEALIAVRDIGRTSGDETLEVIAWVARALVCQALSETKSQSGKRRILSIEKISYSALTPVSAITFPQRLISTAR